MRLKALADHNRVVRLEDWSLSASDLNGTNDMSAKITAAMTEAAAAGRPVLAPVGTMLIGSTVSVQAPLIGRIGNTSNVAKTVLTPGMTDGTPVLQVPAATNYWHIENVRVYKSVASPSASQNCVGIKAGTFHGDPSNGGLATAAPAGYMSNVRVDGCAVGFELQGWLSTFRNLQANLCAIGMKAEYQNASEVDFLALSCGVAAHVESSAVHFTRFYDEVQGSWRTGPSLFDACDNMIISRYYSEAAGGSAAYPWISVGSQASIRGGLVTGDCDNFQILAGNVGAVSSGYRLAMDRVTGFMLGVGQVGVFSELYSTTANTTGDRSTTFERQNYTPVWTAASGSPAVGGGGALTGSWTRNGTTVTANVYLRIGNATGRDFGTGAWSFSLPVPPNTTGVGTQGVARVYDPGVAFYAAYAKLITTGSGSVQAYCDGANGAVGATKNIAGAAFAWVENAELAFSITYETV
jgi:hypothetical protein